MNPRIIAFTKDWNDVPTCTTHVLREMGKTIPVLWVSSIGTRKPKLGTRKDVRRVSTRLRAAFKRAEKKENHLRVLWPLLYPRAGHKAMMWLNSRLMRIYEWRERKWMGDGPIEYWCFVPNAVDLLPQWENTKGTGSAQKNSRKKAQDAQTSGSPLAPRAGFRSHPSSLCKVVYYCVDDWSKFHNLDGAWLAQKEEQLLARADVVFAASRYLVNKHGPKVRSEIQYSPHGVEHAKFAAALRHDMQIPAELADLPGPVIGFYGNILPWVDLALIARLVRARPKWSFVMIGEVFCDVSACEGFENVHFIGRREHDDLPGYCKGFDVAMIPYDMSNPRMESVNPVKAKELLAAGVPIVAADVPELRSFGDDVTICQTDDEWLDALARQAARTDRAEISARMMTEDWCMKVANIRSGL